MQNSTIQIQSNNFLEIQNKQKLAVGLYNNNLSQVKIKYIILRLSMQAQQYLNSVLEQPFHNSCIQFN